MKRPPTRPASGADGLFEQLELDGRDGPALPLDPEQALALVRLARERAMPPASKVRRLPRLPLIGVGVLIASSAAAAIGGLPRWLSSAEDRHAAPLERPAETVAARKRPSAPVNPTAPAAPAAPAPPVVDPPPAAPAPPVVAAPPAAPAAPVRIEPRSAPPRPAHARARKADSAPAADLLGLANRARAERRFDDALATYRRVIAAFPNTRQAQIASVSAGDLELDRGNARAAEELFHNASNDGEVGAEALFGMAEACRAQGHVIEERRALVLFEQRYGGNPLAPAARRRLGELGAADNPSPSPSTGAR